MDCRCQLFSLILILGVLDVTGNKSTERRSKKSVEAEIARLAKLLWWAAEKPEGKDEYFWNLANDFTFGKVPWGSSCNFREA